MKISNFKLKISSQLCLLSLLLLFSHQTFAQTSNLISVAPSIARVDLQTDKPQAELFYKNNTDKTIEITMSASDFTELEDSYQLSFLDPKSAQNYKYSLSSWIQFNKTSLILPPHSSDSVIVYIESNQLTVGGHYAAILAHISTTPDNKNIQINGVLSSLLFVRTFTGKEIEDGRIDLFSSIQEWFNFPQTFVLRFQNIGNVDVEPHGLIEVRDLFGKIVAKGIVNESSLTTFPESIRRYDIPITTDQFLLPGWYMAHLTLHFGKTNKQLSATTQFFSQGSIPLIPIAILIIISIETIMWMIKRKKHRDN